MKHWCHYMILNYVLKLFSDFQSAFASYVGLPTSVVHTQNNKMQPKVDGCSSVDCAERGIFGDIHKDKDRIEGSTRVNVSDVYHQDSRSVQGQTRETRSRSIPQSKSVSEKRLTHRSSSSTSSIKTRTTVAKSSDLQQDKASHSMSRNDLEMLSSAGNITSTRVVSTFSSPGAQTRRRSDRRSRHGHCHGVLAETVSESTSDRFLPSRIVVRLSKQKSGQLECIPSSHSEELSCLDSHGHCLISKPRHREIKNKSRSNQLSGRPTFLKELHYSTSHSSGQTRHHARDRYGGGGSSQRMFNYSKRRPNNNTQCSNVGQRPRRNVHPKKMV